MHTHAITNVDAPQEWSDMLQDISLYAVMIYTAAWFIELFTLGTVVCVRACASVCMHVLPSRIRTDNFCATI